VNTEKHRDWNGGEMNKEPALIVGVIMAILTLLNITLTPEKYESLQLIVEFFVLAGGVTAIRAFVASRVSVRKKAGPVAEKAVFEKDRV
jgi:hypothetical protein